MFIQNNLQRFLNQIRSNYYLYQLRKEQWKKSVDIKRIQIKRLKNILNHSYNNVPYYHKLFSSLKIKPNDINDVDDLIKIPLTTKNNVRNNSMSFIARDINKNNISSRFTSGSTGIPLQIFLDNAFNSYVTTSGTYSFFECGGKLFDNVVTIYGRAQSVIYCKKFKRLFGNIPETIIPLFPQKTLVKILRKINPDIIKTFPSVLSSFAGCDVSGIEPKSIFTQGEIVTEHCRDLMKKLFNSEFFETYGSIEFGQLAFECNEHYGLHILTNGALIEFIDEEGEHISPGEKGEIVVTGLCNKAMPLIRYKIGDVGTITDEKCACGRSWPLIKNIQGRLNDVLILPSDRVISWLHFYHQFYKELEKNVLSIAQYQLLQHRKNEIIFQIVKGRTYDPEMLIRIKNNLETFFSKQGEDVEVIIRVVNEIPMQKTGKRQILISTLV